MVKEQITDDELNHLRSLNNDQLRAIKIRTSTSRDTHVYRLFKIFDALLLQREGLHRGPVLARYRGTRA